MSQLKAAVFCNRTKITSVTLDLLTREIESHGLGVHYCVDGSPCQVEDATVIITFGGDGTVLKAVPTAYTRDLPIMSFRVGSVGFLASFEINMLHAVLELFLQNALQSSERALMKVNFKDEVHYSLNDFVIERSSPSRTVTFTVSIDGQSSYPVVGDGIIFSTNTGSTAYSMAAGGALVDPEAHCFQITPICPHNPFVGSLVLSSSRRIRLEVAQDKGFPMETYVDGIFSGKLSKGDTVEVQMSKKKVRLLREGNMDFVALLKKKLAFGGRLKDDI
ncbi:NAD(+)/NADH kinase [Mesotoga infera]|uniref:NAD(+)/NADH kinase n=1 Tax=Mesotoga infera TaxID=1236046 RepID=UPI00146B8920|nr:NAD(+)/NADH kinase [Mesotoga infera]